jgi:hypothetical protein
VKIEVENAQTRACNCVGNHLAVRVLFNYDFASPDAIYLSRDEALKMADDIYVKLSTNAGLRFPEKDGSEIIHLRAENEKLKKFVRLRQLLRDLVGIEDMKEE